MHPKSTARARIDSQLVLVSPRSVRAPNNAVFYSGLANLARALFDRAELQVCEGRRVRAGTAGSSCCLCTPESWTLTAQTVGCFAGSRGRLGGPGRRAHKGSRPPRLL
eukprot:1874250-Rhodomonas_salina.2